MLTQNPAELSASHQLPGANRGDSEAVFIAQIASFLL